MKNFTFLLFFAVLFQMFAMPANNFAQTPMYYNYQINEGTNYYPFAVTAGEEINWLYPSGNFANPSPAPSCWIGKFYFYMGFTAGNATLTNLCIRVIDTTLTSLPSAFITPTDTVYFRASVVLTSSIGAWMGIQLDKPFYYDHTKTLIVDVSQCSASNQSVVVCQHAYTLNVRSYQYPGSCTHTYYGSDNNAANMGFDTTAAPNPVPPPPVLVSPPNGGTVYSPTDTLVWNPSTGAITYRVQLATDSLFSNLVVNDSTVTTTSRVVTGLTSQTYYWHVNAKNAAGTSSYSPTWHFLVNLSGVSRNSNEIPNSFKLYNNYPNPFNPSTTVKFDLPTSNNVRLYVYNALGQIVTTLVDGFFQAGSYSISWNGSNYPSGLYLYKIEAGNYTDTKKMLMIK